MNYSPLLALTLGVVFLAAVAAVFWPRRGLLARSRRQRRLTDRILGEDALKFLAQREAAERPATIQSIAGSLGVDLNRAALVVAGLIERNLLSRTGDQLTLSEAGKAAGLHLIRAHRLWEAYLSQKTGYEPAEWHHRADIREHDLSVESLEDLSRDLGYPVFDPDGDPIPGALATDRVKPRGVGLAGIASGQWVRVSHVEDEPPSVYAALRDAGIHAGLNMQVETASDGAFRVRVNGTTVDLGPLEVGNVTVERLDVEDDRGATIALSEVPVGTPVVVERLGEACRGAGRRRLLDLGLVRGTVVVPEFRSPGGDPVAYRVRESLVALRETQARNVRVMAQETQEAV